jgi:3'-phosphoadenosine 5'-phosphosulfate sulfotransferase (PAPS reductase)/FAD synthetase
MDAPFVTIAGQPPSSEVRAELTGSPVLLAFSRGKDSVAAWLALREAGVEVVPYHLYLVPRLQFVDEDLGRWEEFFGQHILNLPHPSLFRWLNRFVFQAPERLATIDAAGMPNLTHEQLMNLLREKYSMPNAWICDGVRSADSPMRRVAMSTHGVRKFTTRKVSVVWDWRKAHVMACLDKYGATLGPEYEWFGRSFDGIDFRFLEPLSRHAPDDYQRVLDWFPLADLELFRAEMSHA